MLDFLILSQTCAPWVAVPTLAAVVKTESQFQPLAIGINGGARLSRQPRTEKEAVVTAKWLVANGYNIDMGLGQVNSANLSKTGLRIEDAFNPCRNLAAAAAILAENYLTARPRAPTEQGALLAALSMYNTGSMTRGFSNGYVAKVIYNASTLGVSVPVIQPVQPIPLAGQAKTTKRHSEAPLLTPDDNARPAAAAVQSQVFVFDAPAGDADAANVMVYK